MSRKPLKISVVIRKKTELINSKGFFSFAANVDQNKKIWFQTQAVQQQQQQQHTLTHVAQTIRHKY